MRFQVIAAVSAKMSVFWDTKPCSLVDHYRRFRGVYFPVMEEVGKLLPDGEAKHSRRLSILMRGLGSWF